MMRGRQVAPPPHPPPPPPPPQLFVAACSTGRLGLEQGYLTSCCPGILLLCPSWENKRFCIPSFSPRSSCIESATILWPVNWRVTQCHFNLGCSGMFCACMLASFWVFHDHCSKNVLCNSISIPYGDQM